MSSFGPTSPSNRVRIVVATSVMLTFISYWRAAAIVLNDLASSAFYACGIAEQAVGKSAPWFIVAVMLFSFAVRAVYVESCSMFVRGGVYRVVKEALGRHPRQAQRLRPDVRLHPHRADLRCVGGPVHRRLDQRNLYHRRHPRLDSPRRPQPSSMARPTSTST